MASARSTFIYRIGLVHMALSLRHPFPPMEGFLQQEVVST
jgi:hypothetical protein